MAPTVRDGTDHAKSLFRGKGSQLPLEGQADLQETALGVGMGAGESRRKWCYFNWIPEESKGYTGSPLDTDSTFCQIPAWASFSQESKKMGFLPTVSQSQRIELLQTPLGRKVLLRK